MHPDTYANWVKIKEVFEETGNIENFFYKRACAIVGGGPDPLDDMIGPQNGSTT